MHEAMTGESHCQLTAGEATGVASPEICQTTCTLETCAEVIMQ